MGQKPSLCSAVHLWVWCIATVRKGSALLHLWHYPAESCPEHVFTSPCLFWEAPDLAGKTQVGGGGMGSHGATRNDQRWPHCSQTSESKNRKIGQQVTANYHPVEPRHNPQGLHFWQVSTGASHPTWLCSPWINKQMHLCPKPDSRITPHMCQICQKCICLR